MSKNQAFKEFGESLGGEIILPEDPGYDEARKVYNGMIDKKTATFAYCTDTVDVIKVVNFVLDNYRGF